MNQFASQNLRSDEILYISEILFDKNLFPLVCDNFTFSHS